MAVSAAKGWTGPEPKPRNQHLQPEPFLPRPARSPLRSLQGWVWGSSNAERAGSSTFLPRQTLLWGGAGEGREDLERGVCTWPVGAGTVVPSPPTGHRHSHHGHSPLLPPPPKLQTRGGSLPCSRLCTGQGHIAPRTGRVRPTKGASALPNGHTSEMEGRQREARASMGKSDPATSTDNGCNRRQGRVKWCWTQGLHRNLGSRQCIVGESSPYRDSSHTQGPTLHSLQPLPIPHNAPGPGASTAGRWHPPRDQVRGGARVL